MESINDPPLAIASDCFITDRGRVDNSGAGSFFRVADGALTGSLASTYRSRSSSRVITSGSHAILCSF